MIFIHIISCKLKIESVVLYIVIQLHVYSRGIQNTLLIQITSYCIGREFIVNVGFPFFLPVLCVSHFLYCKYRIQIEQPYGKMLSQDANLKWQFGFQILELVRT